MKYAYVVFYAIGVMIVISAMIILKLRSMRKREMAIEKISNLLTHDRIRGRDIRQALAKDGLPLSRTYFYRLMKDMVDRRKALEISSEEEVADRKLLIRWFRLPFTKAETEAYVNRLDQEVKKNRAAFARQLPELLARCPGDYVAIIDEAVVATGPEEIRLVEDMSRIYPEKFVYICHVVEPLKKTVKIPSLASAK